MAIEMQNIKEERAAAKEWAQIYDLLRLCEAAKSFSNWEAVALAFLSFRHCLPRSEAGATLAKGGKGYSSSGRNP